MWIAENEDMDEEFEEAMVEVKKAFQKLELRL